MADYQRINYTGEIPGPGCEIIVTDDDLAELHHSPEKGTGLSTTVIAKIAVQEYLSEPHKEGGFVGIWQGTRPDAQGHRVHIVGRGEIGLVRVVADPDGPEPEVVNTEVRTQDGHRFYIKSQSDN